ncbi:MAG: helix-turn-helix domain-containing protein [Cyanobacteriota bacterium]
MCKSWGINGSGKSFSYQHLHGVMLNNLNKLAPELDLSHTDYRLMGILIGLWNKEKGKAFPTIDYLAKLCHMSKGTIIKTLKRLVEKNLLIVVKTKGKRNNYYFSNLLLDIEDSYVKKPKVSSSWETRHDGEQIKKLTKKKTSKQSNKKQLNQDDVNLELYETDTDKARFKDILAKLENWSFTGARLVIRQHGTEKVSKLIKMVEKNKPGNPGAYLRQLLTLSDDYINNYEFKEEKEEQKINKMVKFKFWKHIPSNKVLQVLPDVGTHILIQFNSSTNTVSFIEENLSDILDNFDPITDINISQIKNETQTERPSKEKVIEEMLEQGRIEEAKTLSKLWKLKLPELNS